MASSASWRRRYIFRIADFKKSLADLLDETFNGIKPEAKGTWYVEKTDALLPLLGQLSAEQASRSVSPESSSIAAHCIHTAYYLKVALGNFEKKPFKADWDESWAVQVVDEARWEEARQDLALTYKTFRDSLPKFKLDKQEYATYAMANVAHAAFHLGAIRQLMRMV